MDSSASNVIADGEASPAAAQLGQTQAEGRKCWKGKQPAITSSHAEQQEHDARNAFGVVSAAQIDQQNTPAKKKARVNLADEQRGMTTRSQTRRRTQEVASQHASSPSCRHCKLAMDKYHGSIVHQTETEPYSRALADFPLPVIDGPPVNEQGAYTDDRFADYVESGWWSTNEQHAPEPVLQLVRDIDVLHTSHNMVISGEMRRVMAVSKAVH
ncbi:hypothetical protein THASP1DRAFT_25566 [Thamnocephalis sphaerospora]|uniref:Uncharacterized protein n=1 Tax=Thamnocephalis sphaerospora TaxID=78915 RepID=A0A4P9XJT2_9FUNG|nr:hypothetical protein THASP1DRAFT_25566 [Thamnocephalis sphaerospora]|eukprot:RKP06034.1 hypothetical protein THASP1DRAFT_25566 [Thamnocephalis sphaerospora]